MFKLLFFLSIAAFSPLNGSEFEKLMGKESPHWIYVSGVDDLFVLNRFEALYEKNKGVQFEEQRESKIPKMLHFIWLKETPFPPEAVENIRTWLGMHPDWKVKFWTDKERIAPCTGMEVCKGEEFPFLFLKQCFEMSKNGEEKETILLYEILYQEGGLYVNVGTQCLKQFDPLVSGYDFFCGLETPHAPSIGRHITMGNGLVGARSFHPVVGRVIELIKNEWDEGGSKYKGSDPHSKTQLVLERTHMKLTLALLDRLEEDENVDIVFPAAYFFAKEGIEPIYATQVFQQGWKRGSETVFEKNAELAFNRLHKKNHTIRWIGKGALSLNLLAFAGLFFYFLRQKRKRGL